MPNRNLLPEDEDAPFFLMLYMKSDCCWRVNIAEESRIDAEMTQFIESGRTRDKLIELDAMGGGTIKVALSEISSWITHSLSTFLTTQHQERAIAQRVRQELPDFESE